MRWWTAVLLSYIPVQLYQHHSLFTLMGTTPFLRSPWVVYREMLHQDESPITPSATTLKLYSSTPGIYEGRENLRGQHDSLLFYELNVSASNHRPTSVRSGLHYTPTPRRTTCGVRPSNWKTWLVVLLRYRIGFCRPYRYSSHFPSPVQGYESGRRDFIHAPILLM